MAANNQLVFQEGTEIIVDTESVTAAGAWTIGVIQVVRTGPLVNFHIEATGGTGTICTLPADFSPGVAVTEDGNLSVAANGVVSGASSPARGSLSWIAGAASP